MPRFADPLSCPDCRTRLPRDPQDCPTCGLPLRSPLATRLLQTLTLADQQLDALRASRVAAPAGTAVVGWTPEPYPAGPTRRARRGIRSASVPRVLLGLGALCLLVAAVIFLAVAWSWLGVGGRTTVLVAVTLASGALGTWLGARDLRVGAESLTAVALGLLALDVVGAPDAGWLGDPGPATLACVLGAALLLAALALLAGTGPLVVPQVVAPLGLGIATGGALGLSEHTSIVLGTAVLALAAPAILVRGARGGAALAVLTWVSAGGAVLAWLTLTFDALVRIGDQPTVRGLWAGGLAWPLLAASSLLLLPILATPHPRGVVRGCLAASGTLLTVTGGLPVLDEGATRVTLACLAAVAAWTAVAVVVPPAWSLAAKAPMALAAIPALPVVLALLVRAAAEVVAGDRPFGSDLGARLDPSATAADPLLLVPAALVLLAAGVAALPRAALLEWRAMAAVVAVAALATLALEPAPRWSLVLALGAVGTTGLVDALPRTSRIAAGQALAAGALLAGAVLGALPSAVLTVAATGVVVLAAGAALARGRFPYAAAGAGPVLPVALAGLVWSVAEVTAVPDTHRAVPVLLVLGAVAIARPRPEYEVAALPVALAACAVAVDAAAATSTSLAVHLTVAGALLTTSALVHDSRRALAWAGGLLLAAATWVRLADLGVHAPEAYTLPTAVVLVLVGLRRLHRDATASTLTTLAAGLALATVPSLLWVLVDPVTLRAGLLGAGCLAMLLAGTHLRWNAPVLVGALTGGLLVVRELAPYAAETPQWVLIGLAGTVLTVVGVTWERRLRDVQLAAAYLDRLR